jgi:chromosome segregation ATPase
VSDVSEPLNLYELLMGEVGEVPVPHSFEEVTTSAFRSQDLADRDEQKQAEREQAERRAARQDVADLQKFMGRGRSHADVIGDFSELADRADKWAAFQAERAAAREAREREERQQARINELEEQVAASSVRSERLDQALREANEGWGRARAEAAGFRDDRYRSAYH